MPVFDVVVPPGDHTRPQNVTIATPTGPLTVTIPAGVATGSKVRVTVPDHPFSQIPVVVPPGDHTKPQNIQVHTQDGRVLTVTIPAGVATGSTIMVTVPSPTAQAPRQMQIVVPPGDHTKPQSIMVTGPDGRQFMVTIPKGVATGTNMVVNLPSPDDQNPTHAILHQGILEARPPPTNPNHIPNASAVYPDMNEPIAIAEPLDLTVAETLPADDDCTATKAVVAKTV
eukprot:c3426_g1_i1.p1 GENE.c3426_g1_i1~~c3426_g1_i1.p1  ORF type:complete len:243 (-),score=47.77 c3426_g1_i1:67-747(-)